VTHPQSPANPSNGPQAASAASTTEAVRRFSHDVVSPLMSVLALSEVMLLESRNDDRLNEDLRRIHAAAEEALMLVRTLSVEVTNQSGG
jgi:hypothetical protein